jgi:hypothetical protein
MSQESRDHPGEKTKASEASIRKDVGTEEGEPMTFKFETPPEAFAAIAWVVCAADKQGSIEERTFLYDHVQNLDVFKNYSLVEFQILFNRVFQILPNGELFITNRSIRSIIQGAKDALSPDLQVEVFKMAIGLAHADKSCDVEESLLEQLRHGLGIYDTTGTSFMLT